jgi:hypothetical protein
MPIKSKLPGTARQRKIEKRVKSLIPKGVPRWVRIYWDKDSEYQDPITVVFTGTYQRHLWTDGKLVDEQGHRRPTRYIYCSLYADGSYHSQGESNNHRPIDNPGDGTWGGTAMGRKNHLGRRIPFSDLSKAGQDTIMQEYREIWGLPRTDNERIIVRYDYGRWGYAISVWRPAIKQVEWEQGLEAETPATGKEVNVIKRACLSQVNKMLEKWTALDAVRTTGLRMQLNWEGLDGE